MNTIPIPGRCPICGGGPLKPLPLDNVVSVSVMRNGERQQVGGLMAYVCSQRGHVFFVMAKDVQAASELQVFDQNTA